MNLLILGSGGREHALTWKLAQSKKVSKIFVAPGNAGTSVSGTNLNVDPGNFQDVKNIVLENKIDIVVVGPEAPLVEGIHDFFLTDPEIRNIPVIGPEKSAARLEGSKDFAKEFLIRNNIPTAKYRSFNKENAAGVRSLIHYPLLML
jgi:phosphoribosylamine---glycine ligase